MRHNETQWMCAGLVSKTGRNRWRYKFFLRLHRQHWQLSHSSFLLFQRKMRKKDYYEFLIFLNDWNPCQTNKHDGLCQLKHFVQRPRAIRRGMLIFVRDLKYETNTSMFSFFCKNVFLLFKAQRMTRLPGNGNDRTHNTGVYFSTSVNHWANRCVHRIMTCPEWVTWSVAMKYQNESYPEITGINDDKCWQTTKISDDNKHAARTQTGNSTADYSDWLLVELTWQWTHTLQTRNEEPTSSMVDVQKALKINVDMTPNIADEEPTSTVDAQKALKIDVDMTTNTHFADKEWRTNKQHKLTHRKHWRLMLTWQWTHTLQTKNEEPTSSMVDVQKVLKIDVDMTPNTHTMHLCIADEPTSTVDNAQKNNLDNENMNMPKTDWQTGKKSGVQQWKIPKNWSFWVQRTFNEYK